MASRRSRHGCLPVPVHHATPSPDPRITLWNLDGRKEFICLVYHTKLKKPSNGHNADHHRNRFVAHQIARVPGTQASVSSRVLWKKFFWNSPGVQAGPPSKAQQTAQKPMHSTSKTAHRHPTVKMTMIPTPLTLSPTGGRWAGS